MFRVLMLLLAFFMTSPTGAANSQSPGSHNFSSDGAPGYRNGPIRGDGILANIVDKDVGFRGLRLPRGLEISNPDGTLYATLHVDKKSHELYFLRGNKKFIPKVRAFFPEYDILIMDAKSGGGRGFQVFVDGAWRKVDSDQLFFHKWDDFLVKFSTFIPFAKQPFVLYRTKHGAHGAVVDGADSYSFVFKEIDGDWAYVACDVDCEGCPDGRVMEGWIKWKHIDQLAVDLRYTC